MPVCHFTNYIYGRCTRQCRRVFCEGCPDLSPNSRIVEGTEPAEARRTVTFTVWGTFRSRSSDRKQIKTFRDGGRIAEWVISRPAPSVSIHDRGTVIEPHLVLLNYCSGFGFNIVNIGFIVIASDSIRVIIHKNKWEFRCGETA